MTTRREVEEIVARYGNVPRPELPEWLRNPQDEHQFNLAMAVAMVGRDGVEPMYEDDVLVGWKGIGLKA